MLVHSSASIAILSNQCFIMLRLSYYCASNYFIITWIPIYVFVSGSSYFNSQPSLAPVNQPVFQCAINHKSDIIHKEDLPDCDTDKSNLSSSISPTVTKKVGHCFIIIININRHKATNYQKSFSIYVNNNF
jgi:hypothetical protein